MRRRQVGTWMPFDVSSTISPSMAIVPRSGFVRPAIMLTSEVLPAPEAPNNPVTRPWLSKEASSENSPSFLTTSTRSIGSIPVQARRGAAGEDFGADQRGDRDHEGDDHKPQRGGVAIGRLDQRIDGGRDRLGLTRDIRDKGDGGAELADCLGKTEHHAGEHARQRQGQCYGKE